MSITIINPSWRSLAGGWLERVRCAGGAENPESEPLPLDLAVEALGVRVSTTDLSPTLWGLTWNATDVTLRKQLPEPARRFALAHELAHVGAARGFVSEDRRGREWFADWFAREVLVPVEWLVRQQAFAAAVHDPRALVDLASNLCVPESAVLLQTAALRRGPDIWTHGGHVLCRMCGDRTPLPGCACVAYSQCIDPNGFAFRRTDSRVPVSAVACRGNRTKDDDSVTTLSAAVLERPTARNSCAADELVMQSGGVAPELGPRHATGSAENSSLVRWFKPPDRSQVVRLLSVLPTLYPGGSDWLQQRLDDSLLGRAACIVVKDAKDQSLSAVAIMTPKASGSVKLSTFYVAPERRHRGIGRLLLSVLLSSWRPQPQDEIYVTVAHHVEPAFRRLIEPAGFNKIAFEEDRYGKGRHEAVWSRRETYRHTDVFDSTATRRQNFWSAQALGISENMPEGPTWHDCLGLRDPSSYGRNWNIHDRGCPFR
jgi:ribosomal protein S18 acetylase RimI-like enzyme